MGSTSTGIGIDGNEIVAKGDHLYIGAATNDKSIIFRTDATVNVLTLDSSQNATFAGDVAVSGDLTVTGTASFGDTNITNVGSISLDTITNDGTDITLDSSGDIILDAAGNDVFFKAGGTTIGEIENESNNLIIKSSVSDADLILRGNDGGSEISALTFDMSAAGKATFNDQVVVGDGKLVLNATAITATGAEVNLIDGGATVGTTAVASGDGIITNDSGTMRVTNIDTFDTYLSATTKTLTNKTLTTPVIATVSSSSNDFTVDAGADIILDADGADIIFKDAGTSILTITNNSTDVDLTVATQDKDIRFKGDDGGAGITALTLDMSDAGTAVFNHDIRVADGGQIGSASDADAMTIAANGQVTFTQTLIGTDLDISGNVDVDGTLETDALTVNGVAVVTAGANTSLTSILATDLKIGEDDQTKIDFETADTIHFYAGNQNQLKLVDGGLVPITDNDVDLGTASLEFKNVYVDGTVFADAIGFGTTVMTVPSADGSANQILETDGSGTLSFVDKPSSGISMGKAIAAAIVFG